MKHKITPKQIEVAIEALTNQTEPLWNNVERLQKEIVKAQNEFMEAEKILKDNMSAIQSLIATYKRLTGKNPKYNFPYLKDLTPMFFTNEKISDALYKILVSANSPLSKNEIIQRLRDGGAKISLKYPKVVLNTTLKNDNGKRFRVLEDGKVALKEENEK